MTSHRVRLLLLTALTVRQLSAQALQGAPCPRPPARALGAVVIVRDAPPCTLVFRSTGIKLRSDSPGVHPHAGDRLVMDSRGRMYSNAYPPSAFPGMLAAWSPNGTFLKTIGKRGYGPGEFMGVGPLTLYGDSKDRLHVMDGDRRWSIFSPEMELVSVSSSAQVRGLLARTAVLDNGNVLSSNWFTRGSNYFHYFHIASVEGRELLAFGPVPDSIRIAPRNQPYRQIAYAGGTEFVAGPLMGYPSSYELEVWSVEGKLLHTLRREVPWFPPPDPRIPRGPTVPPNPALALINLDTTGVLLVAVSVPNASWRPRPAGAVQARDGINVWLEAIDIRSGTLLASAEMTNAAADTLLQGFVPRRNLRAQVVESAGDRFVELLRYDFVVAPPARGRGRAP